LALLRAGFCLPPVLPRARCALTAPFHHCLIAGPLRAANRQLCIFCATFLQVTLTGRYPAHCPAEFGLSSRLRALRALRRSRPTTPFRGLASLKLAKRAKAGDHLTHCGGDVDFGELLIFEC
jgi:hypothetical protein